MKKFVAIMMVVLTLATAGMASAQVITEQTLGEVIIAETIINEDTLTETNKTAHKEPNYIVTIGGDKLMDVEVVHHPKFVLKVMNGTKKAFAKIKSVFHHKNKKAVTLDN